jgi:hypothetical protein
MLLLFVLLSAWATVNASFFNIVRFAGLLFSSTGNHLSKRHGKYLVTEFSLPTPMPMNRPDTCFRICYSTIVSPVTSRLDSTTPCSRYSSHPNAVRIATPHPHEPHNSALLSLCTVGHHTLPDETGLLVHSCQPRTI